MKRRRSPAPIPDKATRAAAQPAPRWPCSSLGKNTRPSASRAAAAMRTRMSKDHHHRFAFPAVLAGSTALAFGPWLVRLSGVGPVAAGVWRLALALPFLFVIALVTRQPVRWPGRKLGSIVVLAAFFFAADLALWHAGIRLTKLGNATLFGNVSSFA